MPQITLPTTLIQAITTTIIISITLTKTPVIIEKISIMIAIAKISTPQITI
jgi:hypothetical protein